MDIFTYAVCIICLFLFLDNMTKSKKLDALTSGNNHPVQNQGQKRQNQQAQHRQIPVMPADNSGGGEMAEMMNMVRRMGSEIQSLKGQLQNQQRQVPPPAPQYQNSSNRHNQSDGYRGHESSGYGGSPINGGRQRNMGFDDRERY